jgi:hypothetical protein
VWGVSDCNQEVSRIKRPWAHQGLSSNEQIHTFFLLYSYFLEFALYQLVNITDSSKVVVASLGSRNSSTD